MFLCFSVCTEIKVRAKLEFYNFGRSSNVNHFTAKSLTRQRMQDGNFIIYVPINIYSIVVAITYLNYVYNNIGTQ